MEVQKYFTRFHFQACEKTPGRLRSCWRRRRSRRCWILVLKMVVVEVVNTVGVMGEEELEEVGRREFEEDQEQVEMMKAEEEKEDVKG